MSRLGCVRLLLIADTHLPKRAKDLPAEVWDAVEILGEILDNATWDQPQFKVRNSVT